MRVVEWVVTMADMRADSMVVQWVASMVVYLVEN